VAVVTDSLNYDPSYTPFERPPEALTLNSVIPRGIRRFFLAADTSAKPIDDTHVIVVTATLPDAFAYILVRFNAAYTANNASSWSQQMVLRLFNHIPSQPLGTLEEVSIAFEFMSTAGTPKRTAAVRGELANFIGPMWSTHSGEITFRMEMNNVAAPASSAGFLISHVEFLEYDLVQAQRYFINTPQPVLQR